MADPTLVTAHDIWGRAGNTIWEAEAFGEAPSFYPVYGLGNAFSHSPLDLVRWRGELHLNEVVARRIPRAGPRRYWSGVETLDEEVLRVGAPVTSTRTLRDRDAFVAAICAALRADVASIEAAHPGHTNVILCGGRDSLNLLLLPWTNPVLAVSAAPNFELARGFVRDNGLGIDVVEIADRDASQLDAEVLANMCRLDLRHCRWGGELRHMAQELGQRALFWKGQLADTFMTPYWRAYTHPPKLRRLVKIPGLRALTSHPLYQTFFHWSLYHRGAMWQGTHLSLLRDITGALFLSAYHGPAMTAVLGQVDLAAAVTADIRPLVARALTGVDVRYPTANPGPPPSSIREGISGVEHFLEVARRTGLRVRR